jgi:hypothetical protein
MTRLEVEPIIDTTRTVALVPVKRGGVGKHEIGGLRGYRVLRMVDREQFVFSTLSGFVLKMLGELHCAAC